MRYFLAAVLATSVFARANAAETYSIDPEHTHATFSFQHMGFSTFRGKIPAKSGTIVLDRERETGTVDIVLDISGIATGVPKFDDHLRRREEFFDVEKHPTARFESTNISFTDDAPSTVAGTLTIKDIARPVTLRVTSFKCGPHPFEKAPACGANASATIKRSDFGLTYGLGNVSDEIGLEIGVEAIRK